MPSRSRHVVSVAHSLPGRLRLRLPWLHAHPDDAPAIADRLSEMPGMAEVQVRAYTGSVLCRFDPESLDEERIVREVCVATGAKRSHDSELTAEEARRHAHAAAVEGSGVARAAAALFKGIDADILRATEGRLDLAGVAMLGFLAAGLMSFLRSDRLPSPSWSHLAWRAYTIYTRQEQKAISHTPHPLE